MSAGARRTPGAIGPRAPRLAVVSGERPRLRERDIAQLWEGGHLPDGVLVTLEGLPLQVVYRGRPNAGAGPDFRDAVIALPDGHLLHGDVELHLRASDFRRHGHARDPAYRSVILHLVYHADDGPRTVLPGGGSACVVALERWLAARAAELQAMLEQPALWREPCQSAVERLSAPAATLTLARLGERRLRQRAASLAGRSTSQALYRGLLRTLGQGPQRDAWLLLADRVPALLVDHLTAEREAGGRLLEALLFGAAGLLRTPNADGETEPSPYLAELARLWASAGIPVAARVRLGAPCRPANHPARRLAGLARLLSSGLPVLLARLRAAVLSEPRPARALVQALSVPADGVWSERLLPWDARPLAPPAPALIGAGKATELAINAALPVLLCASEREAESEVAAAVIRVFHALPSPLTYGRTAHLDRALRADGQRLITGAARSQGALYLFANYCTQGGCGRCPLS
jgi:hypothetical protein